MASVLVVGLNPAWQSVFSLPALRPGSVNRARDLWSLASGKGLNAAKVLSRRGHAVSVLQILAGENGRRCLADCGTWNLRSLHAWTEGETRVCATLLSGDPDSATEIIAPFAVAADGIVSELLSRLEGAYDAVVVCGTVPRGVPESVHAEVLSRVESPLILWDSATGLTPELLERVTWIKMNTEEFARLPAGANGASPRALITDGPRPARVLGSGSADGTYRPPELRGMLNPIGAGDTVTAMLGDGLLRGLGEEAAVRRALACGSASCLSPLPAEFDPRRALELESHIRRNAA